VGTDKAITVSGASLTGTDAGNYTVTAAGTTADITPKAINASGLSGADKVYDSTTAASLTGTAVLSDGGANDSDGKYYTGDDIGVSGTLSGTFDNKNVGTDKAITVSGASLTGTDAGNYTVTAAGTTADITPKAINASGLSGADKVYDSTTAATLTGTAVLSDGGANDSDGKYYTGYQVLFESLHLIEP